MPRHNRSLPTPDPFRTEGIFRGHVPGRFLLASARHHGIGSGVLTQNWKFLQIILSNAGLCIVSVVAIALTGCATRNETTLAAGHFKTVVIDAGHGGKDSGGTSSGRGPYALREKDLTLETAINVNTALRRAGLKTVMMRNGDYFVELDDRVRKANSYRPNAVLVSIHYNATGNSSERGAETFFWHANSHGLATRVQNHLVAATGEINRGVTRRRLRLTRNPEVPAILCECAFLTNPSENSRVAQRSYRTAIANGIAAGILEEYRQGDAGIAAVPEIYAPMSKASDKHDASRPGGRKRHRSR